MYVAHHNVNIGLGDTITVKEGGTFSGIITQIVVCLNCNSRLPCESRIRIMFQPHGVGSDRSWCLYNQTIIKEVKSHIQINKVGEV